MFRLILVWLFCFCALAVDANAAHHGNTSSSAPSGACPFSIDNGCAAAVATSAFQTTDASFRATAITDGGTNILATYTPPANRAGIEYPVGPDTSLPLQDPTTYNWAAAGNCNYNPAGVLVTSGPTGPVVTCNIATTNITIPDTVRMDFSGASSPSVNNCIALRIIGSGSTKTFTISDPVFKYDTTSFCVGGWIKHDADGAVVCWRCSFDGNAQNQPNIQNPINDFGSGTSDRNECHYCYMVNLGYRFLNAAHGFGGLGLYYSYVGSYGLGTSSCCAHGEIGLMGGGSALQNKFGTMQYYGNTIITPVLPVGVEWTTTFYCNTGNQAEDAASCDMQANTIIINKDAGGNVPAGRALFEQQYNSLDLLQATDNVVYRNGASSCAISGSPTNSSTASATGNVLSLTVVNTSAMRVGYLINKTGFTQAAILPYGSTIDPATGLPTTGTGGTGTYGFSGAPQTVASSSGWAMTPPVTSTVISNNTNLKDGTLIGLTGPQNNGGGCS